jgi:pimeloyl-ACP methyl ester carboxylesterase
MEASPHATAASLATLRDSDLREDIQSVNVPTILFHGLHDQFCQFELAATMAEPIEAMCAGAEAPAGWIRGAKLIRFENSGHALFYEEKDKFNAELVKFIKKKSSREKYFFPL